MRDKKNENELEEKYLETKENEYDKEIVSQNGIVADNFDGAIKTFYEDDENYNDEDGIKIEYDFTGDEVKTALHIFQKATISKRNLVYTIILGIMLFSYVYQIFKDVDNAGFSYFMCFVIVLVLSFVWILPSNHIKSVYRAIENANAQEIQRYTIVFYDDAVKIGEDHNVVIYKYSDKKIRAWETAELFILGYDKQRIFVVPKRCCENKTEQIRQNLASGLSDSFIKI